MRLISSQTCFKHTYSASTESQTFRDRLQNELDRLVNCFAESQAFVREICSANLVHGKIDGRWDFFSVQIIGVHWAVRRKTGRPGMNF